MYLTDNAVVEWALAVFNSYCRTMVVVMRNTATELSWSAAHSATPLDMLVVITAFSSLFGLLISLAVIYNVCKLVHWLVVDFRSNSDTGSEF